MNKYDPEVKREKVHWLQGRVSMRAIDSWRKIVTFGSVVKYHGEEVTVESHIGLGPGHELCVFISGVETPVPLRLLEFD